MKCSWLTAAVGNWPESIPVLQQEQSGLKAHTKKLKIKLHYSVDFTVYVLQGRQLCS